MTIANKKIKIEKTQKKSQYHISAKSEHVPTTNIIKQIEKLTPQRGIIQNIEITPEIATDLMTLNLNNRPIHINTIKRYGGDLGAGDWKFTGDPFKISDKMTFLDGQHRALAIIESGKSMIVNIQTGVPEDSFQVMDTGRVRSSGDALAILGFKEWNSMAAAIRSEIYFREQNKTSGHINNNFVLNHDVVKWVKDENNLKLMLECLDFSLTFLRKKAKFLSVSTWAWTYYILSKKHKKQATEFMSSLATGANLGFRNPIYLLREKLLKFTRTKSGQVGKTDMDIKIKYFIRAWNHYRLGEKPRELKIDTTSSKIENPI